MYKATKIWIVAGIGVGAIIIFVLTVGLIFQPVNQQSSLIHIPPQNGIDFTGKWKGEVSLTSPCYSKGIITFDLVQNEYILGGQANITDMTMQEDCQPALEFIMRNNSIGFPINANVTEFGFSADIEPSDEPGSSSYVIKGFLIGNDTLKGMFGMGSESARTAFGGNFTAYRTG